MTLGPSQPQLVDPMVRPERTPTVPQLPPPPRAVRRRSGWARVSFFRLAFCFIASIWLLVGFDAGTAALAHLIGQRVDGRVDELSHHVARRGEDVYTLRYSVPIGGQTVYDERLIDRNEWMQLSVGGRVPIATLVVLGYRIHDPAMSRWDAIRWPQYLGLLIATV